MSKFIVRSKSIHIFVAVISFVNAILIGVETNCLAASRFGPNGAIFCTPGGAVALYASEWLFTSAYFLDFTARIVIWGWRYLRSWWGVFDLGFVLVSVTMLVALPVAFPPQIASFFAIRIFRLFRLTRSISYLVHYSALWTMCKAMVSAAAAILYAILLGTLVVYVFAIVGVDAFGSVGERWQSLPQAMFALVSIATYDDWASTVDPVFRMSPVYGLVFVGMYFALVPLTLLPLMTAILTQTSLATAQKDNDTLEAERQMRITTVKAELSELLAALDQDDNGEITKEEIRMLYETTKTKDRKAQTYLHELGTLEELEEIFDFISLHDPRQSTISRDEFLSSMVRYKSNSLTFMMSIALQHLSAIRRRVLRCECKVDSSRREMREIAMLTSRPVARAMESRQEAEERHTRYADKARARRLKKAHGVEVDVAALRAMFDSYDDGRDGLLTKAEFKDMFRELYGRKPGHDFAKMWREADSDRSGCMDFDEFLDFIVANGWHKSLGTYRRSSSQIFTGDFDLEQGQQEAEREELARSEALARRVADSTAKLVSEEADARFQALAAEVSESTAKLSACISDAVAQTAQQGVDMSKQVLQEMAEGLSGTLSSRLVEVTAQAVSDAAEKREVEAGEAAAKLAVELGERLDRISEHCESVLRETQALSTEAAKTLRPEILAEASAASQPSPPASGAVPDMPAPAPMPPSPAGAQPGWSPHSATEGPPAGHAGPWGEIPGAWTVPGFPPEHAAAAAWAGEARADFDGRMGWQQPWLAAAAAAQFRQLIGRGGASRSELPRAYLQEEAQRAPLIPTGAPAGPGGMGHDLRREMASIRQQLVEMEQEGRPR